MKPLIAVKTRHSPNFRATDGRTAIVILMALVFGNIGYLTLSAFLVYHQDEVWAVHRIQEDLKMKHQFRQEVDCQLPCAMNQMALKKLTDKFGYSVSCYKKSSYQLKISKAKTSDLVLCPNLATIDSREVIGKRLSQNFDQACPQGNNAIGIDFAVKRLICSSNPFVESH